MALVEGEPGGDLMSDQKWVRSSLRRLSAELENQGHQASRMRGMTIIGTKTYAKRPGPTLPDATAAAHPKQLTQPERGGLAGEASISLPLGFS